MTIEINLEKERKRRNQRIIKDMRQNTEENIIRDLDRLVKVSEQKGFWLGAYFAGMLFILMSIFMWWTGK